MKKVIVIGGGYAGLSCIHKLKQAKGYEICLVDSQAFFTNSIKLHESVHRSITRFRLPYAQLRLMQDVRFIEAKLELDRTQLVKWVKQKHIVINEEKHAFDYLVIATGGKSFLQKFPQPLSKKDHLSPVVMLEDIKKYGAQFFLEKLVAKQNASEKQFNTGNTDDTGDTFRTTSGATRESLRIGVIGGGATAMQFLFELDAWRQQQEIRSTVKGGVLIELYCFHAQERLLASFPATFHDYCYQKIREANINYYSKHTFCGQLESKLQFATTQDELCAFPLDLSFCFPGIAPSPMALPCDSHGHVISLEAKNLGEDAIERNAWPHVFAAGDNSVYDSQAGGEHTASAQVAVRKGRLVGENILRQEQGKEAWRYLYPSLGKFISLGKWDGIAWLFVSFNILRGSFAFAVKEMIEKQFHLLLNDVDTYIDL